MLGAFFGLRHAATHTISDILEKRFPFFFHLCTSDMVSLGWFYYIPFQSILA